MTNAHATMPNREPERNNFRTPRFTPAGEPHETLGGYLVRTGKLSGLNLPRSIIHGIEDGHQRTLTKDEVRLVARRVSAHRPCSIPAPSLPRH